MARINSKSKGSGFEGQIAKKLTVALAPLTFMRSPGSGARLGGKNFATFGKMFGADATKLFVSDVVPTNEKDVGIQFKLSIECKSYGTVESISALVNGTSNIFKWMEESAVDAVKINKQPVLVFKWNRTPIFIAAYNLPASARTVSLDSDATHIEIGLLDEALKVQDFWYE